MQLRDFEELVCIQITGVYEWNNHLKGRDVWQLVSQLRLQQYFQALEGFKRGNANASCNQLLNGEPSSMDITENFQKAL